MKTLIIVIGIVLVITVSTLGASLFISDYRFMETVKLDLVSMSKIASGMLSSETSFLRQEIQLIAERVKSVQDVQRSLEAQIRYSRYLNLSVVDRDSYIMWSAGDPDAQPTFRSRESAYGRRAFGGETVLTTTMYTPNGNLVMYIWTPIDETHVLIAALPGMYFSKFVSKFLIWTSGSIFILDNEGVVIASVWEFRVQERHNYIEWGKRDPDYRQMGEIFNNIVVSGEGVGQYNMMGTERVCAYSPISGTDNWSVAVSAPISESPLSQIQQMLVIFASVFLGLGIIVALVTANAISAPYEKMVDLRKSALAASESKTRFLANMSHEMRTPLNAIIGLAELELGSGGLEGDSFANIEKIYSAGMNLLGIINDLLDISKIESGKFVLVPVEYDVPSMINDTVNLNIVRIGSKPIQFRLHLSENIPSRLRGDELRVKQIFNNLLSNAFKYTDSGYVDWNISCVHEGNRIKLVSTITDTGIGLRKEDLGKLFKDYYQANLHTNYYVEGTGLGLSITNNLIKLMGGAIKVESDYGKGSVFTVEFYQTPVGAEIIGKEAADNLTQFRYSAQRRSRNQKLVRADMSYASVLVVDDVITNLDVTRGMLRPYGITVDCVTSGPEAIKRIREEKIRYNAVFMDHMMPGMDGVETVKVIRREIGTQYAKSVPIIALTANALLGNDSLFLENGFQAFLSKPIDILRLDTVLNQWVRDKKQEKKAPVQVPVERGKAHNAQLFKDMNIPGLNAARGLARFDYSEESYLEILRSYAAHSFGFINTAKAFSGASGDLQAYRVAVHGLKGSSRGIGAEALGDQAELLEMAAVRGDTAFIETNNGEFTAAAEKLIAGISAFLQTLPGQNESKPEKEAPDPELMAVLRRTCETYDIDGLRKAIETLDEFRYRNYPDLAASLREYISKSDFEAVKEKLASF